MQNVDELKQAAATLLAQAMKNYSGDYGATPVVELEQGGKATMAIDHNGTMSIFKDGMLRVRIGRLNDA